LLFHLRFSWGGEANLRLRWAAVRPLRQEMEIKRFNAAAMMTAAFNGALILYAIGWIAGFGDLRRLTDWRGPLLAVILAIAFTAFTLIQKIQAID